MQRAGLLILGAGFALTACATSRDTSDAAADAAAANPPVLEAELRDAAGRVRARSTVEQSGDSLRVRVEAVAMSPGAYGAHIHATGRCEAPAFTTAGPHWNPTGASHGKDNPQGMHKGDLPNLLVGTDGRGSFEYTIPNASISGRGPNPVMDADGAAMVVHAAADDFQTDPSGNSGARVACGVLG